MHSSLIHTITSDTTDTKLVPLYVKSITHDDNPYKLSTTHHTIQKEFIENSPSFLQARAYFESVLHDHSTLSKVISLSEMMSTDFYRSLFNTQWSESASMSNIQQAVLESVGQVLNKKDTFRIWRTKEMIIECEKVFLEKKHIDRWYFYIFELALRELLALWFTGFDELKMPPIMGTNDMSQLSHRIEREYNKIYKNHINITDSIEYRVHNITSIHDDYGIDWDTKKILGNLARTPINNEIFAFPDIKKYTLQK